MKLREEEKYYFGNAELEQERHILQLDITFDDSNQALPDNDNPYEFMMSVQSNQKTHLGI